VGSGATRVGCGQVLDALKRPLRDLRISVTDRCNLRCPYCMPREVFGHDFRFLERKELLTFEEIATVARAMASLGVRTLRITGGEPLLRRELERLVRMLAEIPGIEDIALTTNGLLLAPRARTLKEAGLRRVTVSLDALDAAVLEEMSGAKLAPGRVLRGIEAAREAGLSPVKVNMVVRRGHNQRSVIAMAEHFRHREEILRFIEFMDVGSTNDWRREDVVGAREIISAIDARWPLEPLAPTRGGEVARRYRYADGAGEIGFVGSITEPFCAACTRARLSADGVLYTCLFASSGHDLRSLLRGGGDERELSRRLSSIWRAREDRYSAQRALAQAIEQPAERIEMSYIGG
jgi:GTP 3',8-cyclase